jgi:uncharacterized protein (TIGR00296 family)
MSFELSLDEGRFLVKLARKTIVDFLETGRKPSIPNDATAKLKEKCGVFVTLNSVKRGVKSLRGCIGHPVPEMPLVEATIDSAINSATRDPRFPPVASREMGNIVVEVSVLTPPTPIVVKDPRDYLNEVKVGKDGLIVERGWYKGLLLPQVPVEWNWSEEEFLNNCCMKASLTPDAWLMKGTKIFKFQAIIFREKRPNGEVEQERLPVGEDSQG